MTTKQRRRTLYSRTPARRASTPPERNGGSDYAAPKRKTIAPSAATLKTRSGTTGGASRQPCGTVTARPARIAQRAKPIGAATNAEQHTTSNIVNGKDRGFGGIRAGGLLMLTEGNPVWSTSALQSAYVFTAAGKAADSVHITATDLEQMGVDGSALFGLVTPLAIAD